MEEQKLLGFADEDLSLPPQAARLGPKLLALSAQGIYFGTSSWKYEGWLGSIYNRTRYQTRGKFSKPKFEADCLREYAQTFPVVCGDFAFYQFPTTEYWARLFGESPSSLSFSFKVPEDITVVHWPNHARYGKRAGQTNDSFLDPAVFRTYFTDRLAPYRSRVAPLIFEFGTIPKSHIKTPEDFYELLRNFLRGLPDGFEYAVEIRNPEYLKPEYFDLLANFRVAHVLNAWTRMPTLETQHQLPGVYTSEFTVVRGLLVKGRTYETAVSTFQPYDSIKEPDPETRAALGAIIREGKRARRRVFLYLNNRLEGHAPTTIEAVVDALPKVL